ncbi:UTP20_6 [Sanghuangporus weigelae]
MVDIRDEDGHRADEALVDEECLFHASLSHWMQLNLSTSFIAFAQKVSPLSLSFTLLVHSWREVTELWLSCVRGAEDEAMKALLDGMFYFRNSSRTSERPYVLHTSR